MKFYSDYVAHFCRFYFSGGKPKTRPEIKMFGCITESLMLFQKNKDMLQAFYLGYNSGADWKVVKAFEKDVAEKRGLI